MLCHNVFKVRILCIRYAHRIRYCFVTLGTKSLEAYLKNTIVMQLLYDCYECWFVLMFGHIHMVGMAKQRHTLLYY